MLGIIAMFLIVLALSEMAAAADEKVYGYVYDSETEEPIGYADVYLYNQDTEEYNEGQTDREGYYELWTDEGNINFVVQKDGYKDYADEFYLNSGEERNVTVYLEKKPEENSKIYGYVYEKAGRADTPIEDATVEIYNQDTDEWNDTLTDRNGYYELMTAEGTIEYSVHKDDYVKYSDKFYINDKEEKNVTVYLEKKNSKIYGHVYDDDTQEPLEGADVSLYNEDAEDGDGTQTDSEGYYELLTSEGYIHFEVRADGYSSHNEQFDIGNDEEKNLDVYLKLKPPENSRIYGYVYEKGGRGDGDPLEGASVEINNQDTGVRNNTRTNESGYYEIMTAEGEIEFDVRKDGYIKYDDKFYINDKEEKNVTVHLEKKTAKIYGNVYDDDTQEPLEGADVSLYNEDTEDGDWDQTDSEGYYELLTSEGYIYFGVRADGYISHNEQFDIGNDEEKILDVYLKPKPPENSTIHGYVYEKGSGRDGGIPLQDVEVGVYNEDVGSSNNTESDENGYYEINVAEGTLHIYINDEDGYENYHESFQIGAEEEKEWDIHLIPQNTLLKGYVFVAEKRRADTPIEDAWVNVRNRDTHSDDNGTSTDDAGYYEIWVAEGELEFSINDDGYFSYYDEFNVEANSEYEIDDVYLVEKPDENSIIEGYVYDNKTGEELEEVRVEFYNDEYHYGNDNWTEKEDDGDPGYYMIHVYGGTWDVRVEEDGYQDYEFEITVGEDDYLYLEIYLDPLPPTDSVIKGYVKAENETGLKMIVRAQSFTEFGEIVKVVQSEDNGYYEFDIYGGVPMVMAAFDQNKEYGDFFKFLVIEEEDSETWYNITLYKVRENKATVKGYVKDADGDPLEGARVHLAGNYIGMMMGGDDDGGGRGDDGPNWPYMAKTDDMGYYEFQAPLSARGRADDETFYLVAEYNESHGALKKVTLMEGDNEYDFTLEEPAADNEIHIYLYPKDYDGKEDWNDGYVQFKQPFSMDTSWQTARLTIDFIMGDRDGEVEEGEEDLFMAFLEFMSKEGDGGDGPGEMTDTEDDFYVDNIYYDFEEGFSFGDTLSNVLGPVDDNAIITPDMDVNVTAHEYIDTSTVHTILFNMSYPDDPEDVEENFVIHLPGEFAFFMAKHTDNISVEAVDGDLSIFKIAFEGAAYGDDLWEMVETTVTSEMMGYIERTDDPPGNNHTMEGLSASFEAHFINPEGVTITKTLWDFGKGPCCDNDLEPSYMWTDNGEFEIQFIVVIDSQQHVLDTMAFVVENAVPVVDAGEDIDETVAGTEISLDGSFTDLGTLDTHTVLWEYASGRAQSDVLFLDAGSLTTTVMFKKAGIYTLRLTVTDDDGGSGSDTITATVVNTDPKPQFDNVLDGDVVFGIMDITVSDTDGMKDIKQAKLEYSSDGTNLVSIGVDNTPTDGFSIRLNTLLLQDGQYQLRLTLEDFGGSSVSKEISVEVDNSLPPQVKTLELIIGEDESTLKWTLPQGYAPLASKFGKYKIYRSQANFTDVTGMEPLATIEDIATKTFTVMDVNYAETYYYAVTIEDKEGNENKNVTAGEYKAMELDLENIRISLSEGKPDANKPLRISVEVKNIGGDYARDISVEIYVDDVLEETIGPFSIAPDESVTKTGEWTTETGEHTIKVVVTYDDGKQKEVSKTISVKEGDSDTPGFELAGAVVGLVGVSLVVSLMETRRKRH